MADRSPRLARPTGAKFNAKAAVARAMATLPRVMAKLDARD